MNGDGFVTINAQYYRKDDLPGRRYPVGPAGQQLTRETRAVAFSPHCLNFDALADALVKTVNLAALKEYA